ncbi:hypothetical protein E8E13_000373 [Curvularia kusanoi]|uniref:Uncharacterized protein n=1 Tax=Curvularia kusanoi TaxID=90978 RepID=A0A9P4W7V9_CURKU|nr:hypothetical protein E8E13_000373 [Curvularia kusanoi]
MGDTADSVSAPDAYTHAKPSKFHFKSPSSRRKRHHDRDEEPTSSSSRKDRYSRSSKRHRTSSPSSSSRRHHEHHHRSSRHKHSSHSHSHSDRHPTATTDGSYYSPTSRHRESLFDSATTTSPPPDTLFRESLFDALADDEGAAYWEGVYGQPIHTYPSTKPGPDGTLERMTDEEYADFVRARMWEKTHQHIVQEREAREEARRKQRDSTRKRDSEAQQREREREGMMRAMEESLRRGEERRRAKMEAKAWAVYEEKWAALLAAESHPEKEEKEVADCIPWPTLSGSVKDVDKDAIERFFRAAHAWRQDAAAMLKAERVRWHPDKMQRRFGQRIDADTIRHVTAVFQIIDQLWNARR